MPFYVKNVQIDDDVLSIVGSLKPVEIATTNPIIEAESGKLKRKRPTGTVEAETSSKKRKKTSSGKKRKNE